MIRRSLHFPVNRFPYIRATMIAIGRTLISNDILQKRFVCDLAACKGACCVEGDSGAPLEEHELDELKVIVPDVLPYLTEEGRQAISQQGPWVRDVDGEMVTPLIGDRGACAYTIYNKEGIAQCGIERAWQDGQVAFRKPVSCHLYPIRVRTLRDGSMALNYDIWKICDAARTCGVQLDVKVYRFLKDAIIRKFGEEFYRNLEEADAHLTALEGE
jgi:hypothetical protein